MEKIDILVKGVPVPIHNMFKGFCSLRGKSMSQGVIESMISVIEQSSGPANPDWQTIVDEYETTAK